MPGYFRAVAVDYDGTLTDGARPAAEVLEAIAAVRAAGLRVVSSRAGSCPSCATVR